jgi:hypothetical protein
VPSPLLTTSAPPGVELLLARQGERHLLYLFNHYQVHESLGADRDAPLIAGIEVTLDAARLGGVGGARSAPDLAPMPLRRDGRSVTLAPPPFSIASIVVLEPAGASRRS